MATITWPSSIGIQSASIGLKKSGTQFRSPFNGTLQAFEDVAERWAMSLTLAPKAIADGGAVEALLNQLAGGVNKVALPHAGRPYPKGTLRGSPTLSAGAARGDTSIALTGGAFPNLLTASRAMDNAAWTKDGIGTITANNNTDPEGTVTSDKLPESAANSTHRVYQSVTVPSASAAYSASAFFAMNGRDFAYIIVREATSSTDMVAWFNITTKTLGTVSTGANWSGVSAAVSTTTQGHTRVTISGTKTNAATQLTVIFGVALSDGNQTFAGNTLNSFNVWGTMLEAAAAPSTSYALPTLLAGDMLGVGTHLLQVASDTTISDTGTATVPIVNRIRGTVASGTPVVWAKPTTLWVCPSMLNPASYARAMLDGAPLDLEEGWA